MTNVLLDVAAGLAVTAIGLRLVWCWGRLNWRLVAMVAEGPGR
jgi:hypothetical protein